MRFFVAMDSFKGTLSSREASEAVRDAILEKYEKAEVDISPIADGGEGTTDVLKDHFEAEPVYINAMTPTGKPISALCYGKDDTLLIEVSSCIGLPLVDKLDRDPMHVTSFGVGLLIKNAIAEGYRNFYIGLGGSATNDAGAGMIQALGFILLDKDGGEVGFGAQGAGKVVKIDTSRVVPELDECNFTVLCDVENPLLGMNGCTYVFSPQKGADPTELSKMDAYLATFAECAKKAIPTANPELPSSGAAGGLGFAFRTFLNADLELGFNFIKRRLDLIERIKEADIVISGEGRLDGQSLQGKAAMSVAKIAWYYGKTTYMLCGGFGDGYEECLKFFTEGIEIIDPDVPFEDNLTKEKSITNLAESALQIIDDALVQEFFERDRRLEEQRKAREAAQAQAEGDGQSDAEENNEEN